MSLVDQFSLSDYATIEEVEELMNAIADEISTLRGYMRGAKEKLAELEAESDLEGN